MCQNIHQLHEAFWIGRSWSLDFYNSKFKKSPTALLESHVFRVLVHEPFTNRSRTVHEHRSRTPFTNTVHEPFTNCSRTAVHEHAFTNNSNTFTMAVHEQGANTRSRTVHEQPFMNTSFTNIRTSFKLALGPNKAKAWLRVRLWGPLSSPISSNTVEYR